MPVNDSNKRRVWQYKFRPQPFACLDRSFLGHDLEWEHNVVEQLKRDEAAPQGLSFSDIINSNGSNCEGGWEVAEWHSRNAIRNNSAFLNDEAISRREPVRKAIKEAWEAKVAEDKILWEKNKVIWGQERIEREEARKAYVAAQQEARKQWEAERERVLKEQVEREAEWERAAPKQPGWNAKSNYTAQDDEHILINAYNRTWRIKSIKEPHMFLWRKNGPLLEYHTVDMRTVNWPLYIENCVKMMRKSYGREKIPD